jgi:hypothetical protein
LNGRGTSIAMSCTLSSATRWRMRITSTAK